MHTNLQAEALRAHVLGYFKPRGSPVVVDSSRYAGYLGQSVLLHEQVHQELTTQTSHGLLTYIVDALRDRQDKLTPATIFNLEQELDLLLTSSLNCQEGYASWHQIFYLGTEFSPEIAVQAYDDFPENYQQFHAHFETIAMYFDGYFRSGWGAISQLIGSFARGAMMTPILSHFSERPPTYGELREFLRRPEYNPDERLFHIVRTVQQGDDSLRRSVIAVFDEHVVFVGERDGFRRWNAKPTFFAALNSLVFSWVRDACGLGVDSTLLDEGDEYANRVLHSHAASLGVDIRPPHPHQLSNDAHFFEFDTAERNLAVENIANVAELRRRVRHIITGDSEGGRYLVGGWASAFDANWLFEVACVLFHKRRTTVMIGATHIFSSANASMDDVRSVFGASGLMVIPSMALMTAEPRQMKRMLRRLGPTFVFVEKASFDNVYRVAMALGRITRLALLETPFKARLLITKVRRSLRSLSVVSFVDPVTADQIAGALARRAKVTSPVLQSLNAYTPNLMLAMWVCTHTTASDLARIYP